MKISKLAQSMIALRQQHDIDSADVILLSELLDKWKEGQVTIMQLLENTQAGCEATAHARLNRLCKIDVLRKTLHEKDQRQKILTKGDRYADVMNTIASI
jgi:hypothetical protein